MAKQEINIGTLPGDGTGDPLRTAMHKSNDNFTELYDDAETKVDKVTGKSLVSDTEIAKIHASGSDDQSLAGLVSIAGVETITGAKTFDSDKLKAPDITATNDFTIKTGANKTLVFQQPTYRDEYPAMVVPASGAAAPDEVPHTIGNVIRSMRAFDGNSTEERLSGSFEIPHDYMVGQPIEVHIHWRPAASSTGTVIWYFDYEYSPANAAPIPQTTLPLTHNVTSDSQYVHFLDTFGNMPQPSTPFALGGKIGFNIRRSPTTDSNSGDALLEQIALHIPCDTAGSRQIYIK
jgi:hypothetical protein